MKVVIVGGGASGLLASINIKVRFKDLVDVVVLERLERVGKKILATGGGKGNITNSHLKSNLKQSTTVYNNPTFVQKLLKKNTFQNTIDYFSSMGLEIIELNEGRCYPKSETTNSILDTLRLKMIELNVNVINNFEVSKISKKDNQFIVESTRRTTVIADYVVLACGGKSSPILGSNGSGYNLLKNFKLDVTPIYPGLSGIVTNETSVAGLDGIRAKANVLLTKGRSKDILWEEYGEVQFKKNSISGIVVMNLSSFIARGLKDKTLNNFSIYLDFMPNMDELKLIEFINQRVINLSTYSIQNFLIGLFPKMLANLIIKKARIDLSGMVATLNKKDVERLANVIKHFEIIYKNLDSFEHSQVSVGGLNINEIDESLETKKIKGLYVVGELLDIDGTCGGYNLQWAWTSSLVASNDINSKIEVQLHG